MTITDRIVYESQSFERLIQLSGDRRPFHAYLLVGSSIPTLSRFATAFAAWLNCSNCSNGSSRACGSCKNCIMMKNSTHPSLHRIQAEGNEISISSVRKMIDRVSYKVDSGTFRVFIIESADTMGDQAANAFLKTLESPPDKTIFLLLTNRATGIIPTVSSRCIPLQIRVPSPETIVDNFLDHRKVSPPLAYLGLLLSNSSLLLIENIDTSFEDPPSDQYLLPRLEAFLSKTPKEVFLNSSEPFYSSFTYPLSLFSWFCNFLSSIKCSELLDDTIFNALSLIRANTLLLETAKKHYKEAAQEFRKLHGNTTKDPTLDTSVQRRRSRRIVSQHIVLFLNCLQIFLHLSLSAKARRGKLPYGLEGFFPIINEMSAYSEEMVVNVSKLVLQCRRRLFANVSEKALILDLFVQLHEIVFSSKRGITNLSSERRV